MAATTSGGKRRGPLPRGQEPRFHTFVYCCRSPAAVRELAAVVAQMELLMTVRHAPAQPAARVGPRWIVTVRSLLAHEWDALHLLVHQTRSGV